MSYYVIGLDIGTSGCKAVLVDNDANLVEKARSSYRLYTPFAGWSEQDPTDWWEASKKTLMKLINEAKISKDKIKCIGLSGQMHGLVALDGNGHVLRRAILWNDQRTEEQCQYIYDTVGGIDNLIKYTNNRMLTGYTAGKIIWMRENEPEIYSKMSKVLNPKDYIRFKLTGKYATEVTEASGTGLFDVKDRNWAWELIEKLDVPVEFFPECYESTVISGKLKSSIADYLGLPENLPVAGGAGDGLAQCTGAGLIKEGTIITTLGTAGNVGMTYDGFRKNPKGKLQVFCAPIPNKWNAMGVTLAAGGSFSWLKDAVGQPENELAKRLDKNVFELLSRQAKLVETGSKGLIFLPYLIGERCPHPDPKAKGAFIGLTLQHGKPEIVRSVMEGVMYSLRDVTEVLKEMDLKINEIRISGGGAFSGLWKQIEADVFNKEVITVKYSGEGGAYGAALIGGASVGIWDSVEEAVKNVEVKSVTYPIKDNVQKYNSYYNIYKNLYKNLKTSFDMIDRIIKS